MSVISFKQTGDFNAFENFAARILSGRYNRNLERVALEGVKALRDATPRRTGKTADSWSYEIEKGWKSTKIYWTNDNVQNGVPIAIVLQYGHGTKNGGFVQGRDYINPAIRPIFDKMANGLWEEVTR